ncbi:hypothetical protein ACFWYW_27330 [Nonomuraea sp. NPDC059023]|uniref:hypothetical protein n=1 Tax=unclassified Nonomuraea TaxID=2593643 RepID=UPI0036964493
MPGAYILLDRPDSEGRWGAYVGKATNPGLRNRVQQQFKNRDHWYRVLVIRYESNDDEKLNSTEAGRLEGEIYYCLDSAETVDLHNRNRPQDATLSIDDEASLRDYMIPIESTLRLIGHSLQPQRSEVSPTRQVSPTSVPVQQPRPYVNAFGVQVCPKSVSPAEPHHRGSHGEDRATRYKMESSSSEAEREQARLSRWCRRYAPASTLILCWAGHTPYATGSGASSGGPDPSPRRASGRRVLPRP